MKIIIAGAGEVGTHLAKLLSYEGHDLTVIDIQNSELKNVSEHLDLLSISGNVLSINTLTDAKIQETDLFIAVTHFTSQNISSAILAKKLGARQTIARVRDAEYLKPRMRKYSRNWV